MSAKNNKPPYDRRRWAMYVAFAATPLVLFAVTVWAFLGTDKQLYSVSRTIEELPTELIGHAIAHVDMAILDYSMYVYVHVIVSLAAIFYFSVVMRNHARARKIAIRFEIGFAVSFALVVCLAIVIMTVNEFPPFAMFPSVFGVCMSNPTSSP